MNNDGDVEMEDGPQARVGSPSVTASGLTGQPDTGEDTEEAGAARDAQTNTTSPEPMVLTCSVCKHKLNSAWSLMQHMQVGSVSDVMSIANAFLFKSFSMVCCSQMILS